MTMTDNRFQDELDKGRTPCIPPEDYEGSVADWMVELQVHGIWDGEDWHGDIWIDSEEWWDILETCEGVRAGECSVHCKDEAHHSTCRVAEKPRD